MPVAINVKLDSFNAISPGGQYCTASMAIVGNPPGNVRVDANGILHIKAGAVDLQFTVVPPTNSTDSFLALGIAFQGPATDPRGLNSFSFQSLNVSGATLSIRDTCAVQGNSNSRSATYQFYMFIQRVSDGALGIIDPDIQNED